MTRPTTIRRIRRPGWRWLFWAAVLSGLVIRLVQLVGRQPPDWATAVGGAIVIGVVIWLVAFGTITLMNHHSAASSRRGGP